MADEAPTVGALTQQIESLKASTSEWKKAVKAQLLEAQSKNQQLRQERDQLRESVELSNATVRLQLDSEYKERFLLKDGEITRLQDQLNALRGQLSIQQSDHRAELARKDEEGTASLELLKKEKQADIAKLHRQLAESSAQLASQTKEVTRLQEELSRQNDAPLLSSASAELDALRTANRNLQQDLASLRSQQTEAESHLRDELEAHFQNEIELRDSQISILQTTLQQSRRDVAMYTQKLRNVQQTQEGLVDQLETKAASLRGDLIDAHTQLEALKQENEVVSTELTKMVRRCHDLEADRDARNMLEKDLLASPNRINGIGNFELDATADDGLGEMSPAELKAELVAQSAEISRLKEEHAAQVEAFRSREATLADKEAHISQEMDKLKRQEQRSAEQLSQLVHQANLNLESLKKRQPAPKKEAGATAVFSLDDNGTVITNDTSFVIQENLRHFSSVLRSYFPAATSGSRRFRLVAIAFGVCFLFLVLFSSSASTKNDLGLSDAITKNALYEQERAALHKTIAVLSASCGSPKPQ